MQVFRNLIANNIKLTQPRVSCAIGNFDGMHIGHQHLVALTNRAGDGVALTFDPPPEAYFKQRSLPRIFNLSQKLRAFAELSLNGVVVEAFDAALSEMDPEVFVRSFLKERLNVGALYIGENFRFGKNRQGDIPLLKNLGHHYDFTVTACESQLYADTVISSTVIRDAIGSGDMDKVKAALGRDFMLEGQVVKGDQLGRKIGFPTLNLGDYQQCLPGLGIYAGYVHFGSHEQRPVLTPPKNLLPAAISVGVRPTINNAKEVRVEAHVIDQTLPLNEHYGMSMAIYFCKKIRDEEAFSSLDELKYAIGRDIAQTRSLLSPII